MAIRDKRVLHVLNQFERSGAEMMLLQSAREWQQRGYALDLLATGPVPGPLQQALHQVGYRTIHIPFRSEWRYLPSLGFARKFFTLCHSGNYDVLHLHTEAAMLLFVMLGRAAGVSLIVRTVHNAFTFSGLLKVRKRLERSLARAAGVRFAFVSQSVALVEKQYYSNPGICTTNWFDVDHFRPPSDAERAEARRALQCPEQSMVIVSVGNCGEAKNHGALLEALATISPHVQVLYLHVGREQTGGAEQATVLRLGLGSSVRFAGSCPDTRPYLWAADLFAMPSLREGLSIAALEAVGAGTPALFTRVNGLHDIAARSRWITEVEPGAFADGLLTCCQAPRGLARERAAEDSATIHREFSIIGGVSQLIQDLYCDGHPAGAAANREQGCLPCR